MNLLAKISAVNVVKTKKKMPMPFASWIYAEYLLLFDIQSGRGHSRQADLMEATQQWCAERTWVRTCPSHHTLDINGKKEAVPTANSVLKTDMFSKLTD